MIDTGQVYHATLAVKDIDGNLVNAAAVTLTITLPDGTTVSPAVTNPPAVTGQYSADYATAQAGLHKAAWVTTSPGSAAADYFNVRAFASILSLAEAKNHLAPSAAAATAWTGDDDELRNFLAAVTEVIESKAGACVRRTVVQRVADQGCRIVLNQAPVISVASVTSVWTGGPNWAGASLVLDQDAGIVDTQLGAVPFYYGPWDVTYTTGRAIVPERFIHAAKELLRHLWETQRGQLAAPVLGGGDTFTTSSGFAFSIPNRVTEMLQDDMTPAI